MWTVSILLLLLLEMIVLIRSLPASSMRRNTIRGGSTLLASSTSRAPPLRSELVSKSAKQRQDEIDRAQRCIEFIDASPEPLHVVATVKSRLLKQGFLQIDEASPQWRNSIKTGGKYFFVRAGSSIVAFTVGGRYESGNGFLIIGAHTDSPNLRLKPKSKRTGPNGVVQLNCETYGGGLWHTWFDRDLSVAGRVVLRDLNTGSFHHRLGNCVKVACFMVSLQEHKNRSLGLSLVFNGHVI